MKKLIISILCLISCSVFAVPPQQPVNYTTSNGYIFQGVTQITLHGISWFGMETANYAVHGLWSGRQIKDFLDQMKQLGFNALRLPIEPGILDANNRVTGDGSQYEGMLAPTFLTTFLSIAQQEQMYVLLDYHRNNPDGQSPAPDPNQWINTLQQLAKISVQYPNVIGIDLFNEPHDPTTPQQWISDAENAYAAIQTINPNLLYWVEGIGYGEGAPHWGENVNLLTSITIPKNKLVFSPHTYGPDVGDEPYFSDPHYPQNMPAIWNNFFGNLVNQGYTVCTGEFGSRYDQVNEQQWFNTFVSYLKASPQMSGCWFFWALNPDSGDTGGILNDDWQTVNQAKYGVLKTLL